MRNSRLRVRCWRVIPLIAALGMATIFHTVGGAAAETANETVRRLFVDAVRLSRQAENEVSQTLRVELLLRARERIEQIIDRYPSTEFAVKLITGQKIGDFDPARLDRLLAKARARALPTDRFDPASRAGRYLEAVLGKLSNSGLSVGRPISARELRDSVEIVFPETRFGSNGRIRLGDVGIRIKPQGRAAYALDLSWSGEIELAKARAGAVSLTSTPFALRGRWDEEVDTFTKLDTRIDRIVVTESAGQKGRPIGSASTFRVKTDLGRDRNGLWSGPLRLGISDLHLKYGKREALSWKDMWYEADNFGMDLGELLKLMDSAANLPDRKRNGRLPPVLRRKLESLRLGTGRLDFGLTDLELTEADGKRVGLKQLSLLANYDTLPETGQLVTSLSLDGLRLPEKYGVPPQYVPDRIGLKIELATPQMKEIVFEILRSDNQRPAKRIADLVEKGTDIRVPKIEVEMREARLDGKGRFRADPVARHGVTGRLQVQITGLDRMLKELQKTAPSSVGAEIALLKGLGRVEARGDGRIVYNYDVRVAPEGIVRINGTVFK